MRKEITFLRKLLKLFMLTLIVGMIAFQPIAFATDTEGSQIFEFHCAGCHINGSNIIRRGKNLKKNALTRNKMDSLEAIESLVANGKNNMSAYKDRLTEKQIEIVSAYVLEQAEKDWR